MSTRKPCGNVWVSCRLQVIDDTGKKPVWKTVGTCPWTSKHVKETARKLGLASVWVNFMGDHNLVFVD